MKKIIITQYRKEPSGSILGAWLYHYGVNFNGNWAYDCEMTNEGMGYMIAALKKGNEVEFVERWKEGEIEVKPDLSSVTHC